MKEGATVKVGSLAARVLETMDILSTTSAICSMPIALCSPPTRFSRSAVAVYSRARIPMMWESLGKLRVLPDDTRIYYALLDAQRQTQAQASKILGMPQPKISAIRNYKLRGVSLELLMQALTVLGQHVQIVVSPSKGRSSARVDVAA